MSLIAHSPVSVFRRTKTIFAAIFAMTILALALATNAAMAAELSAPAAASPVNSRFDLIVRGEEGLLYHKYWDNGTGPINGWSDWGAIGQPPVGAASSPTVDSPEPGVVQVFVRGTDNQIWNDHWTHGQGSAPGGWSGWGAVPNTGNATWAPASTYGKDNQPDVFYRGTDGAVWYTRYDAALGWVTPVSLGGVILASPAATTTSGGRLQLSVEGTDNRIYNKWADSPGSWTAWGALPNAYSSMAPAASTGDEGQFQTFFRGLNNAAMYHEYWNTSTGWVGPGAIPNVSLVSSPAAARLHLYYRDSAGNVLGTYYDPTLGWVAPSSKGQPSSDEKLYREQNNSAVYWMLENERHWVVSPEVAQAAGLDLNATILVPDGSLSSVPRGVDLTMAKVQEGWAIDPEEAEASGSWKLVGEDTLSGYSGDEKTKVSGTLKWFRGKGASWYLRRGNYASNAFVSAYKPVGCIWAKVSYGFPTASVSFPPLGGSLGGGSISFERYVSCRKSGETYPPVIPLYGIGYAKAFLNSSTVEICSSATKSEGPRFCSWPKHLY